MRGPSALGSTGRYGFRATGRPG